MNIGNIMQNLKLQNFENFEMWIKFCKFVKN